MTTLKTFRLDPYNVPVVLPHISFVQNEVYFGNEFVASLSSAESEFLKSCDGKRTLAEIVKSTGTDAGCVSRLARWFVWWDKAVPEAPVSSDVVENLILSTGPENAWLGMGGRLLLEAAKTDALVLMCFGSRLDTHYREAFPTLDDVSIICRDEAALAGRLARLRQEAWELPDFVLRNWVLADGAPALTDVLRESLLALLDKHRPQRVFIPAATDDSSTDARLLFEILFALLVEGRLEAELHIYEDTPASEGHRPVDEFLSRFESSYLAPSEYFVDVTESIHRKFSLLEIFHCRFSRLQREAWERSAKRNAVLAGSSNSHFFERFWKVDVAGLN